jgi:ABC-2 type transport system permease protein
MPMFKCFLKIVMKNKTPIFIYTVIFAGLSILMSTMSLDLTEAKFMDESLPIAVIDRDGSTLSAGLVNYLDERHEIIDLSDDAEKLQDALFYRTVSYILFISAGFENDFLLENVKLPNSTYGIYLDNQINGYVLAVKAYLNAGYGHTEANLAAMRDANLNTKVEMHSTAKESVGGSVYYFHYMAYILMAIIISSIGPVLMAFNRNEVAKRIESSSFTLRNKNIQIALGCIITSVGLWLVFVAVAIVLYGNELTGTAGILRMLNSFIYLVVCICIAFLLGQFMKSLNALTAVNNAVTLGMSFICGIFVEQELLGSGVLAMAKFFPAYWYVRSGNMLFTATTLSSADKQLYMEGLFIQLGFAAAIFVVALLISRQKKLNASV